VGKTPWGRADGRVARGRPTMFPGADGTTKYGQDQDRARHFCWFRTERTRRFQASAVREKRW
jgi:hypothetical protein